MADMQSDKLTKANKQANKQTNKQGGSRTSSEQKMYRVMQEKKVHYVDQY